MIKASEILERAQALPPLPGTAVRLMQVINDPRSTVDQIVEVIKFDQAVTGQVLRICNSAYFGLARKVTSLSDAMVLLGTMKVLQLVMSVHAKVLLAKEQTGYGLAPGILGKHSMAVAIASAAFGQRFNLPNVNLAFTAGLLHDIGKVVLNQYVGEEFAEIIRRVTQRRVTFAEAEQEVLGFSHEQIGAMVAERWELPEPIVRCIRYHHTPAALDPPDALVDAVYLANSVCLLLGIGIGEDGLHYRADQQVMDRHGLHEANLEETGLATLADVRRVEEVFTREAAATTAAEPVAS
ncbi:MAG TPA: HDOD domain-containing protein [Phycisphaerae bacterium]|nr:HDOD domain-containing protein [Phycisphaerae bacterium]HNU46374.1 HDOD domain-containing protein [Phycisphaerae bacterium]